jgi:hypothetical protein
MERLLTTHQLAVGQMAHQGDEQDAAHARDRIGHTSGPNRAYAQERHHTETLCIRRLVPRDQRNRRSARTRRQQITQVPRQQRATHHGR